MKKLAAVIMIMLYGLSSTGATLQFHYCCGKLKSVDLGVTRVKECGNEKKMGSKPCCETKQVSAKNQDQQQDVYVVVPGAITPVEPFDFFSGIRTHYPTTIISNELVSSSSPPLSAPLFKLYSVFRI